VKERFVRNDILYDKGIHKLSQKDIVINTSIWEGSHPQLEADVISKHLEMPPILIFWISFGSLVGKLN
jgi:hypothetical protein